MRHSRTIIAVITLSLALTAAAYAAGGRSTVTPLPMQYFCASNPQECTAARAAKAQWNDELHRLLSDVNRQVNRAIRPQANPRGGWKINPAYGDCNDYALTKRSRLIAAGVPAGSLRLAVTKTRRGEPHLVLIAQTTAGDVVLDNLSGSVRLLSDTGYAISSMSSANPKRWISG